MGNFPRRFREPNGGTSRGQIFFIYLEKIVGIDPGSVGAFFHLVDFSRGVRVSPANVDTPAPDKKITYYIKRRPKAAGHVGGPYMDKSGF